jgi:large conductance mechanosensitive channel
VVREFREFISKGNLVEIAIGFIMGLAFAAVVTAFTNVVLGTIAWIFGSDLSFDQIGVHRGTQLVIPIGALVLFFVVKAYNRLKRKEEAGAGPTEVELLTQIRDELRTRQV